MTQPSVTPITPTAQPQRPLNYQSLRYQGVCNLYDYPLHKTITEAECIEYDLRLLTGKRKWEYKQWLSNWKRRYRILSHTSRTFKKLRKKKSAAAASMYQYDAIGLVENLRHEAYYLLKLRELAHARWKNLVDKSND